MKKLNYKMCIFMTDQFFLDSSVYIFFLFLYFFCVFILFWYLIKHVITLSFFKMVLIIIQTINHFWCCDLNNTNKYVVLRGGSKHTDGTVYLCTKERQNISSAGIGPILFNFLLMWNHKFSIRLASGEFAGQSKVLFPL